MRLRLRSRTPKSISAQQRNLGESAPDFTGAGSVSALDKLLLITLIILIIHFFSMTYVMNSTVSFGVPFYIYRLFRHIGIEPVCVTQ